MEQVITQDMALFFDQCHPNSLYGVASEDEEKKYEIAVRKTEGNVITFCLADRTTSHIVPLTMERVFSASEAETEDPLTEFFREYLKVLINRKYKIYRFPNRHEQNEFFEESAAMEPVDFPVHRAARNSANGNGTTEHRMNGTEISVN